MFNNINTALELLANIIIFHLNNTYIFIYKEMTALVYKVSEYKTYKLKFK